MLRSAMVLSAVLVTGAACSRGVDRERMERDVREGLAEQTGLTVDSVTCPGDIANEPGTSFECEARADGGVVTVRVRLLDSQGRKRSRFTSGLVKSIELEDLIDDWLRDRLPGEGFFVDCGPGYRVALPERTFRCTAQADSHHAREILVTILDTDGNVRWQVQ